MSVWQELAYLVHELLEIRSMSVAQLVVALEKQSHSVAIASIVAS